MQLAIVARQPASVAYRVTQESIHDLIVIATKRIVDDYQGGEEPGQVPNSTNLVDHFDPTADVKCSS